MLQGRPRVLRKMKSVGVGIGPLLIINLSELAGYRLAPVTDFNSTTASGTKAIILAFLVFFLVLCLSIIQMPFCRSTSSPSGLAQLADSATRQPEKLQNRFVLLVRETFKKLKVFVAQVRTALGFGVPDCLEWVFEDALAVRSPFEKPL